MTKPRRLWLTPALIVLVTLSPGCGSTPQSPAAVTGISTSVPVLSTTAEPTSPKIIGRPVVIFADSSSSSDAVEEFTTFIRTDRALPTRKGRIRADILLEDRADLAPVTRESTKGYCYSQTSGADRAPSLETPRDAQVVTVKLDPPGRDGTSTKTARLRRVTNSTYSNNTNRNRYVRELGCKSLD